MSDEVSSITWLSRNREKDEYISLCVCTKLLCFDSWYSIRYIGTARFSATNISEHAIQTKDNQAVIKHTLVS